MRRILFACCGAVLVLATVPLAPAQEGEEQYQLNVVPIQSDEFLEQRQGNSDDEGDQIEMDNARNAQAEANFDSLMIPQNKPSLQAITKSGYLDLRERQQPAMIPPAGTPTAWPPAEPLVEVPLKEFSDLQRRVNEVAKERERVLGPAVVLGAAEYVGMAIQGALNLQLRLQVTLGRPNQWKIVPLVGDDVVLVRATVGGRAIPVSRNSGYHVWVTRDTGEMTVQVDILVPARGPRGSIEYDFLVARTPVTRFSCRFPVAKLEPRLDRAVQSEVKSEGGSSLLSATLEPTTRIHLVGFRDLGEVEGQKAKVYAESLNLLSVDEGSLDLFSVIRYTILYSGTKEFQIQVPKGLTVVSADGEGAFRFTPEKSAEGTLIKGETAFPIRNSYEISLRLHREAPKDGEIFDTPLPRCLGVEREQGWLAVEVPGKLKLEEQQAREVLAVDVRQLPEEMIRSSVSPILRAYRYHSSSAAVRLKTSRLKEKEPESGSIDRVKAISTVTDDGNVMTDMHITLRNRLRPSLSLILPPGVEVLSSHLDGQKVKPSQTQDGKILLPLKRSAGSDRLTAFTLSVVLQSSIDPLGRFGHPTLPLPAVDLPVSSLSWSIYLPARNIYTRLSGDIEPQVYTGRATWHQPPSLFEQTGSDEASSPALSEESSLGPTTSAHSGAMPVRIKLPQQGIRLEYARYWINKEHPIELTFFYVQSWLTIPAWMLLAVILAICFRLIFVRSPTRPVLPWVGGALALLILWPLLKLGGFDALLLATFIGFLEIARTKGWIRRAPGAVAAWWKNLPLRFKAHKYDPRAWKASRLSWKILVTVGLCFFSVLLLDAVLRLLFLLIHPLPL